MVASVGAYQLYHKVSLSIVNDPRCITAEVVNSEVRDFDPLNLKEVLWRPILEESRAQQAKEEELRVKLLAEMTLPIYRMRALEVCEEIKNQLAIGEKSHCRFSHTSLYHSIGSASQLRTQNWKDSPQVLARKQCSTQKQPVIF